MRYPSRPLLFLSVLLGMMCISFTVSAQDPPELPNTYASADGTFTFHYPDGWTSFTDEWEVGATALWNGGPDENPLTNPTEESVLVVVLSPSYVQNELPDYNTIHPNAELLLDEIIQVNAGDAPSSIATQETQFDGQPATSILYHDDDSDGQVIVVEIEDDAVAMVFGVSYTHHYEPHQATIEAIASSMRLHDYQPGDVRPVIVNDLNVSFEIPADYYAIREDGGMVFGSTRAVIDDTEPLTGELYAFIASPETLGIDGEDGQMSAEVFNALLEGLVGVDDGAVIVSPVVETITSDSLIDSRIQATISTDEFDGVIVMIHFANGDSALVYFMVTSGELEDFEDVIAEIVDSIQPLDPDAARGETE